MPLSWNEIKARAIAFSKDWEGEALVTLIEMQRRLDNQRFYLITNS